ncbi:UNVERIFIED_CONTAM: hypothetical protein NCL1_21902 [Trichonephila clavipes]
MFEEDINQESNAKGGSDLTHVKNEKINFPTTDDLSKENTVLLHTTMKKRFLGGYKHKLTGKIYHHAIIQTLPSPWKYEFVLRYNR